MVDLFSIFHLLCVNSIASVMEMEVQCMANYFPRSVICIINVDLGISFASYMTRGVERSDVVVAVDYREDHVACWYLDYT